MNLTSVTTQKDECEGRLYDMFGKAEAGRAFTTRGLTSRNEANAPPPPLPIKKATTADGAFSRYFEPKSPPLNEAEIPNQLADECLLHSDDATLHHTAKCGALEQYFSSM